MDFLTIVAVGAVLLLVGVFVGWKLKPRKSLAAAGPPPSILPPPTAGVRSEPPQPTQPAVRTATPPAAKTAAPPALRTSHAPTPVREAAAVRKPQPPVTAPPPAAAPIDLVAVEVRQLKLKLINCFGGNEGAMTRTITYEWKKFSHLSEVELLRKMLYDFERGH
ncbi:MAG TPA: hypothetical protein VJ866_15180 [Pyrinomonadaceae bacterium]|nr:hypothetical protein [Pyrinomonadaceae bacterium]